MISGAFNWFFAPSTEHSGSSTNNSNTKASSTPKAKHKTKSSHRNKSHTKNSPKESADDSASSSFLSYLPSMPNFFSQYEAKNTLPPKDSPLYLARYKQTLNALTNDGAYGIDKMRNKLLDLNEILEKMKNAKTVKELKTKSDIKLAIHQLNNDIATIIIKEMEQTALLGDNLYEPDPFNDSLPSRLLNIAATTISLPVYLGMKIAEAAVKHPKWLVAGFIASQVQPVSAADYDWLEQFRVGPEEIIKTQEQKANWQTGQDMTDHYTQVMTDCCSYNATYTSVKWSDADKMLTCLEDLKSELQWNIDIPVRRAAIETCVAVTINTDKIDDKYAELLADCVLVKDNKSQKKSCGEQLNYLRDLYLFAHKCRQTINPVHIQSTLMQKYPSLPMDIDQTMLFENTLYHARLLNYTHTHQIDQRPISGWDYLPKHHYGINGWGGGNGLSDLLKNGIKNAGGRFQYDQTTGTLYSDSGFSATALRFPYSGGVNNTRTRMVLLFGDASVSPISSIKAAKDTYLTQAISDIKADAISDPSFYNDASTFLNAVMPAVAGFHQKGGASVLLIGESMAGTAAIYAAAKCPTNTDGFEINVNAFNPLPLTTGQISEVLKEIKSSHKAETVREHMTNVFLQHDMIPQLNRRRHSGFIGKRYWIPSTGLSDTKDPIALHRSILPAIDREYLRRQSVQEEKLRKSAEPLPIPSRQKSEA